MSNPRAAAVGSAPPACDDDASPELLVVGVAGAAGDATVVGRAVSMARRTGATLVGVHVVGASAAPERSADLSLARSLVEAAGGTLHEIADDDEARALVDFARRQGASQLILGASRARHRVPRRDLSRRVLAMGSGVALMLVPHHEAHDATAPRRRRAGLGWRRRASGAAAAAVVLALLTVGFSEVHTTSPISVVFPCYLLTVIGVSWLSGWAVGIASAIAATLLENYYFVPPTHTLSVYRSADVVALLVFLVCSLGASAMASAFARRSEQARRARAEARILTRAAATVAVSPDDLLPVLDSLRTVLALDRLAVERRDPTGWTDELSVGAAAPASHSTSRIALGDDRRLAVTGHPLDHEDHLTVSVFAGRLAEAYEATRLREEAAALQALAEVDALRTGLLRAVSHDLRTPLAAVRANVSALLLEDVSWSAAEQRATLVAIDRDVERLTRLITDLLDAGRLEAGVVVPRLVEVALDDLVATALETIDLHGRRLDIRIPDDLPPMRTDPDLLERVLANVIANACSFSPDDQPVRIEAAVAPGRIEVVVSDRGPGIPAGDRAEAIAPFRRLDDSGAGTGLGLSVAHGFLAVLGGSLHLEETPGGGLSVVMEIS